MNDDTKWHKISVKGGKAIMMNQTNEENTLSKLYRWHCKNAYPNNSCLTSIKEKKRIQNMQNEQHYY